MFADRLCVRNLTLMVLWIALSMEAVFLHFGVKGRAGQADHAGHILFDSDGTLLVCSAESDEVLRYDISH